MGNKLRVDSKTKKILRGMQSGRATPGSLALHVAIAERHARVSFRYPNPDHHAIDLHVKYHDMRIRNPVTSAAIYCVSILAVELAALRDAL